MAQPAVRTLTEEDIAAGTYTIFDVLMPVFGYDAKYPTHAVGEARIAEVLAADGVNMEEHLTQPKHRFMSLQGAYRQLVGRPTHVSWHLKTYHSPDVRVGCGGAFGRAGLTAVPWLVACAGNNDGDGCTARDGQRRCARPCHAAPHPFLWLPCWRCSHAGR